VAARTEGRKSQSSQSTHTNNGMPRIPLCVQLPPDTVVFTSLSGSFASDNTSRLILSSARFFVGRQQHQPASFIEETRNKPQTSTRGLGVLPYLSVLSTSQQSATADRAVVEPCAKPLLEFKHPHQPKMTHHTHTPIREPTTKPVGERGKPSRYLEREHPSSPPRCHCVKAHCHSGTTPAFSGSAIAIVIPQRPTTHAGRPSHALLLHYKLLPSATWGPPQDHPPAPIVRAALQCAAADRFHQTTERRMNCLDI
jgi:hypothetical protein